MSRPSILAVLLLILSAAAIPTFAAAASPVRILHTPPASAAPNQQIDVVAVVVNATSAVVLWNNGTLKQAAAVPMTNLSRSQNGGWAYEAWLPAEPGGTTVTYSITATGPVGSASQSYSLLVAAPTSQGFTAGDQQAWLLTMAAVFSMAASALVAIFYYTSLRLRREAR